MAEDQQTIENAGPIFQPDPRSGLGRTNRTPVPEPEPPVVTDEAGYEAVPFGSKYKSGDEVLTKHWRVTGEDDYEIVPEGSQYIGPNNKLYTKQVSQGLDYTTQTLFNMATNDKERRKALEFGYKGKVKEDLYKQLYVEEEGGIVRKPKGIADAPGAALTGMAAPVAGAVLGTIGGTAAGGFVGGVAGAAGGGVGGQLINDMVLALAGVKDRTVTEEMAGLGVAGLSSMAGSGVGRGIAAVAPAIKGASANILPQAAAKFLGANRANLETAIPLAEKGVLIPPSQVFPEAPHLINVAEVFDPAFRTQKPMLESATKYYETTTGVKAKPTEAASSREAGEAVLKKANEQLVEADAKLQQELAQKEQTLHAVTTARTEAETANKLRQAQVEARQAAETAIQAGFKDIQTDVDAALKAVKAGHNSGDLWWSVGEKLRSVRQGIMARAKKMYGEAHELAGDHLPNIENLPERAAQFLEQLPEGFENRFPSIVKQLRDLAGVPEVDKAGNLTGNWLKEPVNPGFAQLHNLRSDMRSNYNFFNLTPDVKEGTFKYFANQIDDILNDIHAIPALKDAAKALREADDFYRTNMSTFSDRNIQAVVSGLESGMPADAKNLFDTLVKEGRSELTKKVREMIGPNLWAGVKAADVQEMLDLSKSLTPGIIDGRRFVSQVLDRHRNNMLEAVHGREASDKLIRQAQYIQQLDGRLPINAAPGDTVSDVINRAVETAKTAKAEAAKNPLGVLNREMKALKAEHARARAGLAKEQNKGQLGFLLDPKVGAVEAADTILGKEDLILAAATKFGEQSPEFNMLRQVYVQRLLEGTLRPGERLKNVSPEVQQLMFPGIKLEEMQKLAKEMDLLIARRTTRGAGQSIAAQEKVENPWSSIAKLPISVKIPGVASIGRSAHTAYYKFITEFMSKPATLKWVLKGLDGDKSIATKIREELRKAFTSTTARRGSETGAAMGAAIGESQVQTPEIESRQAGGPVEAGQPYVVGEQGPEVMVPNQSGTVVPSDAPPAHLINKGAGLQEWAPIPGAGDPLWQADQQMRTWPSGSRDEVPDISSSMRQLLSTPGYAQKLTRSAQNMQVIQEAASGKPVDDEALVEAIQSADLLNMLPKGLGNLLRLLKVLPPITHSIEQQPPTKRSKDLHASMSDESPDPVMPGAQYAMSRAEGGPVESGQPYVVGEQGPEVVVPNQAGAVVPNQGLPEDPFERAAMQFRQHNPVAPKPPEYAENVAGLSEAALSTILPYGKAAGLIAQGVAAAPKAAAAIGGLAGATFLPTSGAETAKLTKKQQQELEMRQQQINAQREADKQRIEAQKQADIERGKSEAEARQTEMQMKAQAQEREMQLKARLEQEAIAKADAAREEQARKMQEATFRERYPTLSTYISGAGMAASALLPYGMRLGKAMQQNAFFRAWDKSANLAEQALREGDKELANIYVSQLKTFKAQSKNVAESTKGGIAPFAVGAAAPMEISMLPEQADLIAGSPQAKEKATETLLDWHRIPAAVAQGATFAGIGSKLPVPSRVSPQARSEGLVKSQQSLARRKPKKEEEGGIMQIIQDMEENERRKVPRSSR